MTRVRLMTVCSEPGCPNLSTYRGKCDQHKTHKDWTRRGIKHGWTWHRVRTHILQRDGHSCRRCGDTSRLEVHHTDGNPANNHDANLITLCHDCHTRFTHHREG